MGSSTPTCDKMPHLRNLYITQAESNMRITYLHTAESSDATLVSGPDDRHWKLAEPDQVVDVILLVSVRPLSTLGAFPQAQACTSPLIKVPLAGHRFQSYP